MSDPVADAAQAWRDADARAVDARAAVVREVQEANTSGASEYELAKRAGVTRNTVRAWLGKGTK